MNKITELEQCNLWISDIDSVKNTDLDDIGAKFVINLSGNDLAHEVDVEEYFRLRLQDGLENEANKKKYRESISVLLEYISKYDDGVINCDAGISRSVSVMSTVIAIENDITFTEALEKIKEERPTANPHPVFREWSREIIDQVNN